MVTSPHNRNCGESGQVCWGVGGSEGSCEKRWGCREVCWGVGEVRKDVWGGV